MPEKPCINGHTQWKKGRVRFIGKYHIVCRVCGVLKPVGYARYVEVANA